MTFRDARNRQWTLSANVATVKRIRDLAGVNILDLGDSSSNLVRKLHEEPWVLCDILYAALKPEMDAADVSSDDFGQSMGGDCLAAGFGALQGMLLNFSSGGRRDLLGKIFAKSKEVETLTTDLALEKLEDPELITRIRRDAEQKLQRLMAGEQNPASETNLPTG